MVQRSAKFLAGEDLPVVFQNLKGLQHDLLILKLYLKSSNSRRTACSCSCNAKFVISVCTLMSKDIYEGLTFLTNSA